MDTQNSILILFAHPAFQKSRVNRLMLKHVRSIKGVYVHDLYQAYPEFDINPRNEQALLEKSDVIVFQHPFFWYSTPAIIKEWLDLVLEHGWAYGSKGKALQGKAVMHAITTGGSENAYRKEGLNRYTMEEFLRPMEQTARLCGMNFLPPFVVHGTHQMPPEVINKHAMDYRKLIQALRDGSVNLQAVKGGTRINSDLNLVLNLSNGG